MYTIMARQISINQAVKDDSPRKIYITGAPPDGFIYIHIHINLCHIIYLYVCMYGPTIDTTTPRP